MSVWWVESERYGVVVLFAVHLSDGALAIREWMGVRLSVGLAVLLLFVVWTRSPRSGRPARSADRVKHSKVAWQGLGRFSRASGVLMKRNSRDRGARSRGLRYL